VIQYFTHVSNHFPNSEVTILLLLVSTHLSLLTLVKCGSDVV